MSRATAFASAAAGQPRSPRTVATSPSCASAPAVCAGSSGWSISGTPSMPAYARAFRNSSACWIGAPSSLNADRAGVGELAERREAAPLPGRPWRRRSAAAGPASRTRPRHASVAATIAALSIGGVVLGIAQTVVNPPCAAAASPRRDRLGGLVAGLAKVRVEVDEARRHDDAPVVDAPSRRPARSTDSRMPSRTTRSAGPATARRPGRRARRGQLEVGPLADLAAHEARHAVRAHPAADAGAARATHRHPDRHAVRDLLGDQRPRAGRDVGRDLDALVHRAGVHDEAARCGEREPLRRQAELRGVLVERGQQPRRHPLLLDPERHDGVRARGARRRCRT